MFGSFQKSLIRFEENSYICVVLDIVDVTCWQSYVHQSPPHLTSLFIKAVIYM